MEHQAVMKTKKITATGAVILLIILAGCSQSPTGSAIQDNTVKIGVIATLTGFGAYLGQQEVRGLELAATEINAHGGINGKEIILIIEDSKTQPKDAVTATNKLIHVDKVKYIIGDSWSTTTAAIVPLTNLNKVILISPDALLDSLSVDDYFFRTIPTTLEMVKPLAQYAFKNTSVRTIVLMIAQNPYAIEHGNAFKAEFEKLGGKVLSIYEFEMATIDLRSELTKIKTQNPDAIFNLHASGPPLGRTMKQAIELGIDVEWFGSFGVESAALVAEFPEASHGIIYPYPYDPESTLPSVTLFINKYQKEYGELPDNTAANAYDALMVLATALQQGSENPDEVKKAILNINNFHGASGLINFDENGDIKQDILIKQIQNGEFITIS